MFASQIKSILVLTTFLNYIVISQFVEQSDGSDELVFIQVISRHGARSPIHTYSNDPYQKGFWKQGLGQLTEYGMFQTHELGQILRQLYVDGNPYKFLSSSYLRDELYVRSSDMDRTLMSGSSCMMGLYPQNSSIVTPIPVHTVTQYEDKILFKPNCPKRDEVFEEVLHSDEAESMRLANVEKFRTLAKYTKQTIESFEDVVAISDNLHCVDVNNWALPDWALLGNKSALDFLYKMQVFYTNLKLKRNQSRLVAGTLLKHLVDNMLEKVNDNFTSFPSKANFYFTHDSIIEPLLDTLGLFNGKMLPFAAAVIMELHRTNNSDTMDGFNVKILFRNSSQVPPHVLTIPGCQEKCPLPQFIGLTKHNFISNWEEECFGEKFTERDYLLIAMGCACVAFFLISMASVIFAFMRHRLTKKYRNYVKVETEVG